MKTFTPAVKILADFPGTATIEELSKETSVYAASPKFVRRHCGPIANMILSSVPDSYYEESNGMKPNIDIRVHRLNVGEYPAVPGWHCDGALRETYHGAPLVDRIPVRNTVLATVSTGGVSNFQIIDEPFTTDIKDELWDHVNRQIKDPRVIDSVDGRLYQMSVDTLHRCMPATKRGWRLFFRMSMWHNDYLGDEGKIATQQQVYIKYERGW